MKGQPRPRRATHDDREGKCLSLKRDLLVELEITAARERRSQSSIVEELLEAWLDDRHRRCDPDQQVLEVGA